MFLRKVFVAVLTLSALSSQTLFATDKEEITKQIPAAAAMKKKDFEALAASPSPGALRDSLEPTLTAKLFTTNFYGQRTAAQLKELEFLAEGSVKPSELAEEVYRSIGGGKLRFVLAPVTMIHANRIREVTCDIDGNTARGAVRFEVPKLYRGMVEYSAAKKDGQWTITEFRMPAHDIRIAFKEGRWVEGKEK